MKIKRIQKQQKQTNTSLVSIKRLAVVKVQGNRHHHHYDHEENQ